jgi:hypothetical protein
MSELFDPRRMIPRESVPEFYVNGPRHLEILPNDVVRVWLCQDQPVGILGLAPMSIPVLRILMPIDCYVWNVSAHMEWGFDRGIMQRKPCGPAPLRPSRCVMM